MRKKLISLTLALLYFSVSIIFASTHTHSHNGDQCLACSWHLESNADEPVGPQFIPAPPQIVLHTPAPEIQADSIIPRLDVDRGPPVHS